MALLDLNLHGELITPAVVVLKARGIPILLFTGSSASGQDGEIGELLRLVKPGFGTDLADAIAKVCER